MDTDKILSRLGISELNVMQRAAVDAFKIDKDMVLLSPTGTGKTLAFLLPLADALDASSDDVQAVVLVPSRELALQIETVFKSMGTPLRAMSCYGGRPAMDEHRAMTGNRPQVIIGTPGRMNDHLRKHNFDAATVRTLVIDEFDKCLELGFEDEMSAVISQLSSVRKRVLTSATDAVQIPQFVGLSGNADGRRAGKDGVVKLDFRQMVESRERLTLNVVKSPEKDKLNTLLQLLCTLGSAPTMVFVNYRESVERVTGFLQANRFPCDMFHGGMEQDDRERSLYKFRNASCPVLVSTDLASRGLDIPVVENIVHYHLPVNEEAFTHRNGRTARWDAKGSVFMLLGPEEQLPEYVDRQDTVEYPLPEDTPKPPRPEWSTIYIGRGKKDKLNKVDIVGFLYKKGGLERSDLGAVDVKDRYAFAAVRRAKMKQLMTLVSHEKIKGMRTLIEEAK